MHEKLNKFLLVSIIVLVLLMSIGYSALNKSLNISGNLTYRPQKDVRITNFTTGNKPSNMTINYSDFSKTEVKLGYTTTSSASITYTVEVTNYSNTEIGILKIGNIGNGASVQDNIVGVKLLNAGGTKTFNITFTSTKAETKTYLLTFDFEPVYKVTYNGFSSTSGYKTEVLKGSNFSQNFGSNGPGAIYVTMGGVVLSNYTYTNKTITIDNVSGNIDITILTASHLYYNNTNTGLSCSNVQCAIDEINRMIK